MIATDIIRDLHGSFVFSKHHELTADGQKELVKGKPGRRIVVTSIVGSVTTSTGGLAGKLTLYNGDVGAFTNTFAMTPSWTVVNADKTMWINYDSGARSLDELLARGFPTHEGDSLWMDFDLTVGAGAVTILVNGFFLPADDAEITNPDRYLLF